MIADDNHHGSEETQSQERKLRGNPPTKQNHWIDDASETGQQMASQGWQSIKEYGLSKPRLNVTMAGGALSMVCLMQAGGRRAQYGGGRHTGGGGNDRRPDRREPPPWGPHMAMDPHNPYTFEEWSRDVAFWCVRDERDSTRRATAILTVLEGSAYHWAREQHPTTYMQGGLVNGVLVDPTTFVMHNIANKYAQVGEEARMQAMTDLMTFDREHNERIDELIDRFERVVGRANATGQLVMSMQGLVLVILRAVGVNEQQLERLLTPTLGLFPNNLQEFNNMLTQLRRIGHIVERHPGNIADALRRGSRSTATYYMDTSNGRDPIMSVRQQQQVLSPDLEGGFSGWTSNNLSLIHI